MPSPDADTDDLRCLVCGQPLSWQHDHQPDMSGLDDGPYLSDRATRRAKYGPHGHR